MAAIEEMELSFGAAATLIQLARGRMTRVKGELNEAIAECERVIASPTFAEIAAASASNVNDGVLARDAAKAARFIQRAIELKTLYQGLLAEL